VIDVSIITAAVTALTIGLSCGSGCSPFISLFLSSYIVSHSVGIKKAMTTFISFFIGKVTSVVIFCVIASCVGKCFVTENGYIGNINIRIIVQCLLCVIGIILIIKWIFNEKSHKCGNCHKCDIKEKNPSNLYMFLSGFIYGATPCIPMVGILGYCAVLPVKTALITGIVFGFSSILTPITLMAFISGAASKKIIDEIPEYLKWFRLAAYITLLIMPFVNII